MNGLKAFRFLSWAEGVSLLTLLLLAMPLKYLFGMPMAVRIAGSFHGVLFLALVSTAIQSLLEQALPSKRVLQVIGWSFVPFGFLIVDRALRRAVKQNPRST